MKKLVTVLIVVLPLIFVVAIFAITSVARVGANIPATGIEIGNRGEDGKGTFYFDIADYGEQNRLYERDLGIQVLPTVAKNRDFYLMSVLDAETGEQAAAVSLEQDGNGDKYFALSDVGKYKITYASVDGGHQASVQFVISASDVVAATPTLFDRENNPVALIKSESGDCDYVAKITSGEYLLSATVFPNVPASRAQYISADPARLTINAVSGEIDALFSGNILVTQTIGKAAPVKIMFEVTKAGAVTINGRNASTSPRLRAPLDSPSFSIYIETEDGATEDDISLSSPADDIRESIISPVENVPNAFLMTVNLREAYREATSKRYTLSVGGKNYNFVVEYAAYSFNIFSADNDADEEELLMLVGDKTTFAVSVDPKNQNIRYSWNIVCDGAIVARTLGDAQGDYCEIEALSAGKATLIVHWIEVDGEGNVVGEDDVQRTISVSVAYSSLSFAESGETHGDGMLAIASHRYNDDYSLADNVYTASFQAKLRDGEISPDFTDLDFEASNGGLVDLETNGNTVTLKVKGTGVVTITATWKYGERRNVLPANFTFNAVDGVQIGGKTSVPDPIDGYIDAPLLKGDVARDQLYRAMQEERKVVLGQDVYLGEDLYERDGEGKRIPDSQKYDDGEMLARQLKYVKELPTTWDWTYQKNLGEAQPTVKYALEITADIYGNGNAVNAEYLTNTLDSTDKPTYSVFAGPLDFVSARNLAAVKGQDNIVFLARKKGLTIDNVSLKGCNDNSLYDVNESGELDMNLSLLQYTGTTLEIMNDVTLKNSRVSNGRTVVRIYGKDGIALDSPVNVAEEKINVTIDGCVLQSAREFILKIGTNRTVRGDATTPSPYLTDGDGNPYKNHNSSACDDYVNDAYFMQNYLLTEVTLKDSVLRDSALFAIGFESHFAGSMLAGSPDSPFALPGWENLAATSYPALLHLVGNVVLADWKKLDNVDSSTLIELESNAGSNLSFLNLDVKKMLNYVREWGEHWQDYQNLIDQIDGQDYVHGGIAFYGGGKNYHMLDTSLYTFEPMQTYNINLSVLASVPPRIDKDAYDQGTMLPSAAGDEDFRFVMFDATSNYRYNNQIGA